MLTGWIILLGSVFGVGLLVTWVVIKARRDEADYQKQRELQNRWRS